MATRRFWKTLRLAVLLFILFIVSVDAWLTKVRSTDWQQTLHVVIYPINGDASERSAQHIAGLDVGMFADLETFIQEEASHYGVALTPAVTVKLAPPIQELPPKPPRGSLLGTMWWSLKMRYWAYSRDSYQGPADVQIFVVYFDPEQSPQLEHSLGLEKGLIGVVYAFASEEMVGENHVVIAHEFLHTLGATDKYDPANGQPIYPQGYGEPELSPRYPQKRAEIMGGKIAISANENEMPNDLEEVVIGPMTAREINWLSK